MVVVVKVVESVGEVVFLEEMEVEVDDKGDIFIAGAVVLMVAAVFVGRGGGFIVNVVVVVVVDEDDDDDDIEVTAEDFGDGGGVT